MFCSDCCSFCCHRLFLRLLEHLCKVKSWSWALWKGSVIARNSCVGFNHLLQCLKQHGGPPVPISRLLLGMWQRPAMPDGALWWAHLVSLGVSSRGYSLVAQSSFRLSFAGWKNRRKGKEKKKQTTHWMCCPQGCCLLMPWHFACSHFQEIGSMCPFLEGILTFMLCLR